MVPLESRNAVNTKRPAGTERFYLDNVGPLESKEIGLMSIAAEIQQIGL